MENTLHDVLTAASGLCYDSTSMALDIICETLFYDHGILATWAGRSIYINNKRAASIKTTREPIEGGSVICIYEYFVLREVK